MPLNSYIFQSPYKEFDFQCPETFSCSPIEVLFPPGIYLFELWGASGANSTYNGMFNEGGKGGYSRGVLSLINKTKLFLFIGGTGKWGVDINGGWNGGGNSTKCGGSGGGSTDIRYDNNENEELSLKSRILVAGGGGGSYQGGNCHSNGGNGGGESGTTTSNFENCVEERKYACYGTQSNCEGKNDGVPGLFGKGASGNDVYYSGGGGGYWGGGSARIASGGGSSYINGTSLFKVKSGYTKGGVHFGNGKIRITLLYHIYRTCFIHNKRFYINILYLIIVIINK